MAKYAIETAPYKKQPPHYKPEGPHITVPPGEVIGAFSTSQPVTLKAHMPQTIPGSNPTAMSVRGK